LSGVPDRTSRGLGRGLEVLIGGAGEAELLHLPVETIHPNPRQPRRRFEPEATSGLAASIRAQGVLQPVIVRSREAGGYELIAGERRWRAAREAGVPTIPAVVRQAGDRDTLLLGLVENVAREDLSPIEEARAYASLVDEFELSLGEVAERVGRSKASVSNRLRLLELPDEVLWMVARGELTEGHARAVLSVPDHDARRRLAARVVREGLSVRATERLAQAGGAARKPRRTTTVDPALAERVRAAAERLTGLPARVGAAGRLEISFASETQLEELAEALETAVGQLQAASSVG
jgi:ParB family chromosome partitioning protein